MFQSALIGVYITNRLVIYWFNCVSTDMLLYNMLLYNTISR